MSSNICIIPARGGSKRIPKKNIMLFNNKPIISYSIDVAKKSGLFTEIMVSTDNSEIADISKSFGASVPFLRSSKNSDDYATTVEVVKEVIKRYEEKGFFFDNICCLYPTAPLVQKKDLINGYNALSNFESSLPIVKYDFPVLRSFKIKDGLVKFRWPEHMASRSQDLEAFYHDAGQWYWIQSKAIKKYWNNLNTLITPCTKPIILNSLHVQDIDDLDDWKLAQIKYDFLNQ